MKKALAFLLLASSAFAAEGYHVIKQIPIGGNGDWDYVTVDQVNRRLYASHSNEVAVVDLDAEKTVGRISDLHGVHGIAIANEYNKGFITNDGTNSVTVFDLKTMQKTGEVTVGTRPDAICYEGATKRVFAFNGGSRDSTAIDAKTNAVVATFPLGGRPEFCATAGDGIVYSNIMSTSELAEIDAATPAVKRRVSIAPCVRPSGLALDAKNKKAFSVCSNQLMVVTDVAAMSVVTSLPIGRASDGVAYDPEPGLAFSSNGVDANLTIVGLVNGKYAVVDTVPTELHARTLDVDRKTHRLYLLGAKFGPPPPAAAPPPPMSAERRAELVKEFGSVPEGAGVPFRMGPVLPDTFHVLVVGK
jgi:DNA-binding beta-propeller fold protein YncE